MSKFQFRKKIKLAPGLRLNVTKTGLGLSAGPKGISGSLSSQGRFSGSIGIPGSGVSYRSSLNKDLEPDQPVDNSLLPSILDNAAYISLHGPVMSGKEMRKALFLLLISTVFLAAFVLTAFGSLGLILNPFLPLYVASIFAYLRESKKNKKLSRERKIDHLQNCDHVIPD